MNSGLFYQHYSAAGDIIAITLCIAMYILLQSSYMIKRKNLKLFLAAVIVFWISCISSIAYHYLWENMSYENAEGVYFFRFCVYGGLIWIFALLIIYIRSLVEMTQGQSPFFWISIIVPGVIFTLLELFGASFQSENYVGADVQLRRDYYLNVFRTAYAYYAIYLSFLLMSYRKKMVSKALQCIWWTLALTTALLIFQGIILDTTFTCVIFAFPMLALFFLFHYNSCDMETGTLDNNAFNGYINDMRDENRGIIFLTIQKGNKEALNGWLKGLFHSERDFESITHWFRLNDNTVAVSYDKELDDRNDIARLTDHFLDYYRDSVVECHVISMYIDKKLQRGEDYTEFCHYMETDMHPNEKINCTEENIEQFINARFVADQLKDISEKKDLNDPRVLVYCQPILNTKTKTFTSAESLMRLELPDYGMVYPNQFIPLAERFGYIHELSLIILNKTCIILSKLLGGGYDIEHISVNFSIQELRMESFCDDVEKIISDNEIPFSKVAFELTETKNDNDFKFLTQVMSHLQSMGINFLLDDFGTGYSNFERIVGLPIDVIKFDRSLTLLASKDDYSEFMVSSFANIFKKAGYQILFEGIETEEDEKASTNMSALYLQGFKYSKPIPIEKLFHFLKKIPHHCMQEIS